MKKDKKATHSFATYLQKEGPPLVDLKEVASIIGESTSNIPERINFNRACELQFLGRSYLILLDECKKLKALQKKLN